MCIRDRYCQQDTGVWKNQGSGSDKKADETTDLQRGYVLSLIHIYIIRGQQVMLDKDLAEIYGYEVKKLNQQVKRNIERFPAVSYTHLALSSMQDTSFAIPSFFFHGVCSFPCWKDRKSVV